MKLGAQGVINSIFSLVVPQALDSINKPGYRPSQRFAATVNSLQTGLSVWRKVTDRLYVKVTQRTGD